MKTEFELGKFATYAIICLAVGMLGTGALAYMKGGFNEAVSAEVGTGDPFSELRTLPGQNIKNIEVLSSSSNITLTPGDGQDMQVRLSGNGDLKQILEKYSFVVEQQGNTAHVELRNKEKMNFDLNFFDALNENRGIKLEVSVPKQAYDKLQVDVTSGDVVTRDLDLQALDVEASSGQLTMENLTTKQARLQVTSGEINVKSVKSEHLTAEATSGNLNLEAVSGELQLGATSGNAIVRFTELSKDVDVNLTSGDVQIYAPKSASFQFEGNVTSGNISVGLPNANIKSENKRHTAGSVGSGGPDVRVQTTSGNIQFKSY